MPTSSPSEAGRGPKRGLSRRPAAAGLLVFLLAAAACVPGPPQELAWMRQDIQGLQDQVRALRAEVRRPELAAQVKEIDRRQRRGQQALSDRLVEIESRLSDLSAQVERIQAASEESQHRAEEAQRQLTALTARVAAVEAGSRAAAAEAEKRAAELAPLASRLTAVEAQVEALTRQVDALLARAAAPKKAAAPKGRRRKAPPKAKAKGSAKKGGGSPAPKGQAAKGAATQVDPAVRSAYEAALKEIRSGDRRKGVAAMEAFAKAHPHTALTDNAFFWIGQGYYALGDYRNAILNFDNLLIRFPDSDKAPGALLKEGLSFLALAKEGKGGATFDDARLALQQVVHDYPGTREAKLAKEALAKIEGK